jgi:hypothetical protein
MKLAKPKLVLCMLTLATAASAIADTVTPSSQTPGDNPSSSANPGSIWDSVRGTATAIGSFFDFNTPDGRIRCYVGIGVLVLTVVSMLLLRRSRRRQKMKARAYHAPAGAAITHNARPTAVSTAAFNKPKPETSLAGLKHSPILVSKAANGSSGANGFHGANGQTNGVNRKRAFDYDRYFTDLMSTVSNSGLSQPNSGNVLTLGAKRAPMAASPVQPSLPGMDDLQNLHSEMIAHQKTLIEEQKRLIHEQSRLIEEKGNLIAEKNQLLKMQSEWIESKLL